MPAPISKTHLLGLTQFMILQNCLKDYRFAASKWEHFNMTGSPYSVKSNSTHSHVISVYNVWYFLRKATIYRHVAPTATAFAVSKYSINWRTKTIEGTNLEVKYLTTCHWVSGGRETFSPLSARLLPLLGHFSKSIAVKSLCVKFASLPA